MTRSAWIALAVVSTLAIRPARGFAQDVENSGTPMSTKFQETAAFAAGAAGMAGTGLEGLAYLAVFNGMMGALASQVGGDGCAGCEEIKSDMDNVLQAYRAKFANQGPAQPYPVLNQKMLAMALLGRKKYMSKLKNPNKIVLFDHTLCSAQPRLFIINLTPVVSVDVVKAASGYGTDRSKVGWDDPAGFSDKEGSGQSELGCFVANQFQSPTIPAPTLKLEGLEEQLNAKSGDRGVLIHKASYVPSTDSSAAAGHSAGCQAVDDDKIDEVTKDPGFLDFSYFNVADQLDHRNKDKNPACNASDATPPPNVKASGQ